MKSDNMLDMFFPRKLPNFRTPMSRKLVGGTYIYRKTNVAPVKPKYERTYNRRHHRFEDDATSAEEDEKRIEPIVTDRSPSVSEDDEEPEAEFTFTFPKPKEEIEPVYTFTFVIKKKEVQEEIIEPIVTTTEEIPDEKVEEESESESESDFSFNKEDEDYMEEEKEDVEEEELIVPPEPVLEPKDDSILVEELDIEKQIVMSGYYRKGNKVGTWWWNYKDGSALVGELNCNGKMSGENVAYIYPDRWTALVGHFEDGIMIKAKLARVNKIIRNVPEFYFVPASAEYKYDLSTHDCISNDPLLPDPYENERVYVNRSNIIGAGEGLFAKMDFGPGVVVSFYNGVRLGNDEVDARSWDENGYTMIVSDHEVLDVPPELVDARKYCASLGHKLNHSFQPNCVTELFTHPRFGYTVAVRTNQAVKKGSELTINYGYGLRMNSEEMDVPDWYRRQLELFVNS